MRPYTWFSTIKQRLAYWLYTPLGKTPWQRGFTTPALGTRVVEQSTEGLRLPSLIEGIAGGRVLPYPPGTWASLSRGTPPHRMRTSESGPMPPIQHTGAIRPVRMLPIPRVEITEADCTPILDGSLDETIEHPRTRARKEFLATIEQLKESEREA